MSLLILIAFVSCSKNDSVNIRLKNISQIKFENASYNNVEYGEINPNQNTEYRLFESSYAYGSFSVKTDTQGYNLQPIDYVGEELLSSGEYTFELDLDQDQLRIELIKD